MTTTILRFSWLLCAALGGLGWCAAVGASEPASSARAFIHGRVTLVDQTVHAGRIRWGGKEEALWSHYFNGVKAGNPWADSVPQEQLMESRPIRFLGIHFGSRRRKIDLERPLMVRFGDIARIDAAGRDLDVTLKSGRVVALDRFEADDFADGLHLWDSRGQRVELDEWSVRRVEFLPAPGGEPVSAPLRGTVATATGTFSGAIQWDREASLRSDELVGRSGDEEVRYRFDAIRSIIRTSAGHSRVVLRDGRERILGGTRAVGEGNRGVYVDDPRYGRVLVSWQVLERLDFNLSEPAHLPAYGDYPPGRPLRGRVDLRAGEQLSGRIVFDLDESETTQTLDAPLRGVHYTIPFGMVASIHATSVATRVATGAPAGHRPTDEQRALVSLHNGERLRLERKDDLGANNAGVLVFVDDAAEPAYVPWNRVDRIQFDPPATLPPKPPSG